MTESPIEVVVLPVDIRACKARYGGYCTQGLINWCRTHSIGFRELMRGQVTATQMESLGDFYGNQMAAMARERSKK